MAFTREQKKEAYKKLSVQVQDFVMANETTDLIEQLLRKARVTETELDTVDNEIFCALLGLQTLSAAINKVAGITHINQHDLLELKDNLQKEIFNKKVESGNSEIYSETTEKESEKVETSGEKPQNGVGQSFEQIILNQAKAMRSINEEGSSQQPVASSQEEKTAPENLPTENNESTKIHDYKTGADPYREPTE